MAEDNKSRILGSLGRLQTEVSGSEARLVEDLAAAVHVTTDTNVVWAPGVDPLVSRYPLFEVPFPSVDRTGIYGPRFAFLVQVPEAIATLDDSESRQPKMYGVPVWIQEKVPLTRSGLLERNISCLRVGEGTPPEDKLLGIIARKHSGSRDKQVLSVEGVTIRDLMEA